jgi:hypothetical protein
MFSNGYVLLRSNWGKANGTSEVLVWHFTQNGLVLAPLISAPLFVQLHHLTHAKLNPHLESTPWGPGK